MNRITVFLDRMIFWLIVFIPFSVGFAPAPMNIATGLLMAAFLAKKVLRREPLFTRTSLNIPLLLFFLITCLSLIHSVNIRDTVKGGILRLLQYILVFFILVQEIRDARQMRKIFFAMTLGALLVSLDGIWQVFTGRDVIRGYAPVLNLGLVRATASFKDSNLMGIYLSALSPFVFCLTLFDFRGTRQKIFLAVSALVLAGILLTYSRPTLLAVYCVLLFMGIVRKSRLLVAVLLAALLLAPFALPRSVREWAKSVEYNPVRFMCNDDRIAVYRNSLHMIQDHPLIGLGANTYMKNYKKYREEKEYRGIQTQDYMYAHNNFLHMAAEVGLLGFGVFLWLLVLLLRQCRRIYYGLSDDRLKVIALSLAACLIAFLVNGLTESSLYYSRVAMLFWYLAGCALALDKFRDDPQAKISQ